MPQIYDNIENHLVNALTNAIGLTERADFCVGYFNLRGWKQIDSLVEKWPGGEGHCCRLMVGMQQMPQDELRAAINPIIKLINPRQSQGLISFIKIFGLNHKLIDLKRNRWYFFKTLDEKVSFLQ